MDRSVLEALICSIAEMEQMSQDAYRTAQKYEIEQVATQFLADFEKLAPNKLAHFRKKLLVHQKI